MYLQNNPSIIGKKALELTELYRVIFIIRHLKLIIYFTN